MARHAQSRARTRLSRRSKAVGGLALSTLVGTALWAWPASGDDHNSATDAKSTTSSTASGPDTPRVPVSAAKSAPNAAPNPPAGRPVPGLSDAARKRIPADSRQVLVVTGKGMDSFESRVVLYTREEGSDDWEPGPTWSAHNAAHGWTDDHHYGDLRSPIGVFSSPTRAACWTPPGTPNSPTTTTPALSPTAPEWRASRWPAPSTTSSPSTTTGSPAPPPGPAASVG